MPRCYVDLQDGDELIADAETVDLPDHVAVRLAALDALPEISPDARGRPDVSFTVTVRNEAGSAIFRATLSLAGEWLDNVVPFQIPRRTSTRRAEPRRPIINR